MKKKILSFLTAFAMVFGIIAAPFTSAKAAENISTDENATTKTVTLHKLMMTPTELKDWKALTEDQYDGGQDLAALRTAINNDNLNEVAGVYFALKFADDYGDEKLNGKYVKAASNDKLKPANPLAAADGVDDAVGGLTKESGIEFKTEDLKGKFEIDEITEKTTYKKDDGSIITASKAVPVVITLPLVNSKGTVVNAHVYPKNTEEKPKMDKNFGKEDNTTENNTANDLEHAEGFDQADTDAGAQAGANYENSEKTKETAKAEIGKKIPYEVKTEIPANSKLATAKWDDKMTEGLTYNKDLVIKYQVGEGALTDFEQTEYTKTETENGFVISLNEAGLKKVNNQESAVTVFLQYTATVNSNAITDIPESNNVMFHYGNNPSKSTTPIPTNPSNGELKINKTWDNGVWTEGEKATFKLYDANTGKEVTETDLVNKPEDYTFQNPVEIGYDAANGGSYTWKGLDDTKEYIAIEVSSTSGSEAEYKEAADGTITVVNHRSDNPKPLNPTDPKVVTGGKKFVKTNNKNKGEEGLERLAGAEFYVKNGNGVEAKYLVSAKKDANAVKTAKATLDEKVNAYNNLSAEDQKGEEGTKAKAAIDEAQKAYNKAFKENATAYTWGEKTDNNVVVLTSDAQGRFEISGLEYGTYYLEEKTAPKDYAKIADQKFEVKKGSYAGSSETELQYNEEDANAGYGQQVKNKKVTIPETGGIGSLIFVAGGLIIMAGAFIAYKRSEARA